KELLRNDVIGKIVSVQCNFFRNIMPGIGNPPDGKPPAELDWDMLLGPAPQRAYNPNRGIYHFRWFWDYSGGQMTNLGAHSLDIAHWCLGAKGPRSVTSIGGRFSLRDNVETPDTQDALFDYGDWTAVWSHREASAGAAERLERGQGRDRRRCRSGTNARPALPGTLGSRIDKPIGMKRMFFTRREMITTCAASVPMLAGFAPATAAEQSKHMGIVTYSL